MSEEQQIPRGLKPLVMTNYALRGRCQDAKRQSPILSAQARNVEWQALALNGNRCRGSVHDRRPPHLVTIMTGCCKAHTVQPMICDGAGRFCEMVLLTVWMMIVSGLVPLSAT
jgi:hypothetical protein